MIFLDLLYLVAVVLLAPAWMTKKREGWRERFGHIAPPQSTDPAKPTILLHAVSVGETNALRTLVPLLTPHANVIITATTDTGLKRATDLFADQCHVVRFPLDFSRSVTRFLNTVQPQAVGLVELELWPNFLRSCRRRSIPVAVINGRLSARSFKGYRRVRFLTARLMFTRLSKAAVQNEDYARRFSALGTPRVEITGSMKWDSYQPGSTDPQRDAAATQLAADLGIDLDRPLIVAGSTGPAEEALLHDACPAGVQLACAPRKPDRFDEAAAALPGCTRRSRPATDPNQHAESDRFLLDTIGELSLLYRLATVVVVGRSFYNQHGSDPIEPIALGKPTLIGPAVEDFADIVAAFESAGAIERVTRQTLAERLESLLADAGARDRLVDAGREVIAAHQGAAGRHANLLLDLAANQ